MRRPPAPARSPARRLRDSRSGPGTVSAMPLAVSHPHPGGHVVMARLAPGARVMAAFVDEEAERDLTGYLCDLVLVGMEVRYEADSAQSAAPAEEVEVAVVRLDQTDDEDDQPSFVYAHPATQVTTEFEWDTAAGLVALGIARQITAGVAAEAAAGMADTVPEDLEPPPGV